MLIGLIEMFKRVVGVDSYCPYECEVLSTKRNGIDFEWNMTLYENVYGGGVSFYVLQIVRIPDHPNEMYAVYCRAGTSNGDSIIKVKQCQIYQKFFDSEAKAISEFKRVFKSKTKNDFDGNDFDEKRSRYKVLTV